MIDRTSEAVAALGSIVDRILQSPLAALAGALAPWVFSAVSFFVVYRFLPNARLSLPTLAGGTALAVVQRKRELALAKSSAAAH